MTRKDRFYHLMLVGFIAGACIIAPQIRAAELPMEVGVRSSVSVAATLVAV
ncbi:hypothetical protein [Sphingomonas sp. PB4P5]|uniref:hypothetical protein n=1 Tax=Parasphingomonas puruogangriensis TaxID=3096155 RepID=UPI002FC6D4A9